MNKPMAEDMARDLEADLKLCEAEPKGLDSLQRWERELFCLARTGWPAAIRRALAAEAEVERLRKQVEGHAERIAAQSELLSRRAEEEG